jgi:hypothetical protein
VVAATFSDHSIFIMCSFPIPWSGSRIQRIAHRLHLIHMQLHNAPALRSRLHCSLHLLAWYAFSGPVLCKSI